MLEAVNTLFNLSSAGILSFSCIFFLIFTRQCEFAMAAVLSQITAKYFKVLLYSLLRETHINGSHTP